jgi:hypothetical protein
MSRIRSVSPILLVALALGLSWDVLFYGKPLGISALLFTALLLAALFYLGRRQAVRPAWRNLWLLAPLIFFAAMICLRANPFLTFLNVAAGLALLGLVAHFYAAGHLARAGLLEYPLVLLLAGGNALVRPAPLAAAGVDWAAARERSRQGLLPAARGCLLALPLLLVFTCLLASADLVFASYIQDVLHLKFLSELLEWLWRGVLILAVAWMAAGGLVYALGRAGAGDEKPGAVTAAGVLRRAVSIGFIETAVVLACVDLLFLAFVWVQFVYLFGGQANISIEGYTYAEYARRGFFELLAVSIMTQGLILGLHGFGRRETRRQEYAFKGLSSLMAGLVLVILASAFKRMLLYEAAYGYTHLRLYSHIFEAWLAFTFVWFLITLWLRPQRFALGAFAAALGFVLTLNLVNPDVFIARQNLARYLAGATLEVADLNRRPAGDELDVAYLARLSDDAVPLLVEHLDRLTADDRAHLNANLHRRLNHMEEDTRWRRWPAFHAARWQAYQVLKDWRSGG